MACKTWHNQWALLTTSRSFRAKRLKKFTHAPKAVAGEPHASLARAHARVTLNIDGNIKNTSRIRRGWQRARNERTILSLYSSRLSQRFGCELSTYRIACDDCDDACF